MKIKLMNLFAASFAAATLFSCSNEVEGPAVGNALNPGEAGIEIDLGGGKTTYSTEQQEKDILNGSGKLFTSDGVEIPFKGVPSIQNGKFIATVVLPEGKPIVDANLFLYANTGDTPIVPATTIGASAMDNFANATAAVALSRDMLSLPAGLQTTITLNEGSNNTANETALKRSVSRIGARAGGAASIAGFKVSFDKANISGSTLFKGSTDVAAGSIPEYALTGSTTGTGNTEAIAYMYPSTDVEVTITPLTGSPAIIEFSPELNKNYTLVITPVDPTDPEGSTGFTVTIEEWGTGGDVDVDFNGTTLPLKTDVVLPAGISLKDNKLHIAAGTVAANPATGIVFPLEELLAGTGFEEYIGIAPVESFPAPTRVNSAAYTISKDKRFAIGQDDNSPGTRVYALTNYGEDITYKVAVMNANMDFGYINFVVKGLPENFLTSFAGLELMSIAFTTSIDVTAGIVEEVNAATGASWAEKLVNFTNISVENFNKVKGIGYTNGTYANKCPAGFRAPKTADLVAFMGRGYSSGVNQTVTEAFAPIMTTGTTKVKTVLVNSERPAADRYAFTFQDTSNKEYTIVGLSNIVDVTTTPNRGFNRFITWQNQVQTKWSNGAVADTYLRCVKESQPDLAYN